MYNDEELLDIKYVAIRFNSPIDRKCMDELYDKSVITTHRELCAKWDSISELANEAGITDVNMAKINTALAEYDKVQTAFDDYVRRAEDSNMLVISKYSEHYPKVWNELKGMPEVLFAIGKPEILGQCYQNGAVSIVGSRNPGRYSQLVTKDYSEQLSDKDIVIVSGMAMGIDRTAHVAAANKHKSTIAVLPCGADVAYPENNKDLYGFLCKNGLVLSELPPGQSVIKQYFPARNRLIAALADVTLIMEAGLHSGTLHTASYAAIQGKEVMVLPNTIYETNSIGGLYLLRDGAEVLLDVDSVIDKVVHALYYRLGEAALDSGIDVLRQRMKNEPDTLSEEDWKQIIVDDLSVKAMTIDELVTYCKIPFDRLAQMVAELEEDKKVVVYNGKYSLTFAK